jgi:hypothetical protein
MINVGTKPLRRWDREHQIMYNCTLFVYGYPNMNMKLTLKDLSKRFFRSEGAYD